MPVLVGGTGQYIQAIVESWDIPPAKPIPTLRQALEKWGREVTPLGLHQRLAVLDPQAAQGIDPRNVRRTIRALEVIFSTGDLFSRQKSRSTSLYQTFMVGLTLPREELYQRIDQRIEGMLEAGLVDEVKRLLDRGYSPDLSTLSAIGYRQIVAYLQHEITFEEAVRLIKKQTRVFVRRQANWFKSDDPGIHWVTASVNAVDTLEALIMTWLADLGASG